MKVQLNFNATDVIGQISYEDRTENMLNVLNKFIKFRFNDEHIKIEFDTETGEAKVIPVC